MAGGWVYIITNRPEGTLYIGVTSDLARRIWEHREAAVPGFSKTYNLTRLVWFEAHATIEAAIRREKTLKRWLRDWKLDLVRQANPAWRDLYDMLNG